MICTDMMNNHITAPQHVKLVQFLQDIGLQLVTEADNYLNACYKKW